MGRVEQDARIADMERNTLSGQMSQLKEACVIALGECTMPLLRMLDRLPGLTKQASEDAEFRPLNCRCEWTGRF